jgi:hypothetical protein
MAGVPWPDNSYKYHYLNLFGEIMLSFSVACDNLTGEAKFFISSVLSSIDWW